jgi:hypothetical protein
MSPPTRGRLNLANATITATDVHSYMKTAIESSTDSDIWNLVISGTGPVQVDGNGNQWKAAGVILMMDKSGKQNWTFKAGPFISTLVLVATHVGTCAQLVPYSTSMRSVQKRRDDFGANIGESVKGSKGGEFPVEIIYYCVDISGKIRDPMSEFGSLNSDIHEVITSELFRKTYLDCMREDPKTAKLAERIKDDSHSTWRCYKTCHLLTDYPAPLNKYLLDADVKQAIADLTGKTDAGTWSESERRIAFHNGVIPGTYQWK